MREEDLRTSTTAPNRGIFVSYRREDAAGYAGRLYDALSTKFGVESVFIDVDTIEAGRDFVEAIDQAVGSSAILIALIGRQWATATDQQGRRRLENPQDFVRLEIKTALDRDVLIVPVLVGGAVAPSSTDMPEDLAPLARRHAHELSDTRWRYDVDRLIAVLERNLEQERQRQATKARPTAPAEPEREPSAKGLPSGDLTASPPAESLFGPYRLGGELGRGGMGIVYLATHTRLNRRVALKVLTPQLRNDPEFRQRFERESMLAAALEHPNIVPIYDAGEIDGLLYIAMRLVDGRDLGEVLRQEGALPAERAMSIVSQAAEALDYAHMEGLIHRDVKPANIMLTPVPRRSGEHVFLTDFGLARRQQPDVRLTKTGYFVGTIAYTSPEQFTGDDLDPRADIYSLGCVLFECLTASVPFDRPTDPAIMYAHLTDPPPPASQVRPELPAAVDEVIRRAMAKDRKDRYDTAADMAEALRHAFTDGAAPPAALTTRRQEPTVPSELSESSGGAPGDLLEPPAEEEMEEGAIPVPPTPSQQDAIVADAETRQAEEVETAPGQDVQVPLTPEPPRRRRTPLLVGMAALILLVVAAATVLPIVLRGTPERILTLADARLTGTWDVEQTITSKSNFNPRVGQTSSREYSFRPAARCSVGQLCDEFLVKVDGVGGWPVRRVSGSTYSGELASEPFLFCDGRPAQRGTATLNITVTGAGARGGEWLATGFEGRIAVSAPAFRTCGASEYSADLTAIRGVEAGPTPAPTGT